MGWGFPPHNFKPKSPLKKTASTRRQLRCRQAKPDCFFQGGFGLKVMRGKTPAHQETLYSNLSEKIIPSG
jgi:hypothetical protein